MKEQNAFHPSFTIGLWSQAVALIMGIGLHTSAILAGRSVFLGTIFTPALDLLFVPFITLGGILGIRGYVPWRAQSGWRWRVCLFLNQHSISCKDDPHLEHCTLCHVSRIL